MLIKLKSEQARELPTGWSPSSFRMSGGEKGKKVKESSCVFSHAAVNAHAVDSL